MLRRNIILISTILAASLACSFVTSHPPVKRIVTLLTPKPPLYTISGSLQPVREITVPADTRVLVLWMVSDGDDHAHIFGEGVVDFKHYSFKIDFDEPPPPEALNSNGNTIFGVGFVILTANQEWNGDVPVDTLLSKDIIGISANHIVLYIDGNFESVPDGKEWWNEFGQGYNVGQGVETGDVDILEPVPPDGIQIIIDDLENIELLNFW